MASKKFLAGIVAFVSAAAVQAAPVPLTSTVALSNHLTTDQSLNFQIDVNSLLAGAGLTGAVITSGTLTVTGFSDPFYDLLTTTGNGYVKTGSTLRAYQDCNGSRCTTKYATDYTHIKDVSVNFLDLVADTMVVAAGDSSESASATDFAESYTDFGDKTWDKTTGSATGGFNYFYHRDRSHFMSLSGGLEVMLNLDDVALADLSADGILDLSISSFEGQFDLSQLRLEFLAEEIADPSAAVPVPLPTSLLLTGLGLAALGTMRRRRRI
jgi:hypothetical protein